MRRDATIKRFANTDEVYKVTVYSTGKYNIERLDEAAETSLINMGVEFDEPELVFTYDSALLEVTTYVCRKNDVTDALLNAALDRLEHAHDSDEIASLVKLIEDVNKCKSINSGNVLSMFR